MSHPGSCIRHPVKDVIPDEFHCVALKFDLESSLTILTYECLCGRFRGDSGLFILTFFINLLIPIHE